MEPTSTDEKTWDRQLRDGDLITLGRYGGDEFVWLLPEIDLERAGILAEKIRTPVATPACEFATRKVPITISPGVAALNSPDATPADLVLGADKALYAAKTLGRNRISST